MAGNLYRWYLTKLVPTLPVSLNLRSIRFLSCGIIQACYLSTLLIFVLSRILDTLHIATGIRYYAAYLPHKLTRRFLSFSCDVLLPSSCVLDASNLPRCIHCRRYQILTIPQPFPMAPGGFSSFMEYVSTLIRQV